MGSVKNNERVHNSTRPVIRGLDTAHSSYLHYERIGDTNFLRNRDGHPRLDVDVTPYGFHYVSTRDAKWKPC